MKTEVGRLRVPHQAAGGGAPLREEGAAEQPTSRVSPDWLRHWPAGACSDLAGPEACAAPEQAEPAANNAALRRSPAPGLRAL